MSLGKKGGSPFLRPMIFGDVVECLAMPYEVHQFSLLVRDHEQCTRLFIRFWR
jgi:hypothetical protein